MAIKNSLTADLTQIKNSDVEINAKAQNNFKKLFPQITNERWEKLPDGYSVFFTQNSFENFVLYSKRGNWLSTVLKYTENKLPKNVREQIKSVYFDYTITQVDEVDLPDKTVYLVHMHDKDAWKIVRVCDDEMDVFQAFENSNKNQD